MQCNSSGNTPYGCQLYLQALKEAFGVFCNKEVTGKRIAELLVTFFDNILKKGGSEKLNDEYTLEEVCITLIWMLQTLQVAI